MKEFTNEDRSRHYGKRVGDRVREVHAGLPTIEGTVVELGGFDNNRIYVKKDSGDVVGLVAEWCEIIEKVEDIQKRENTTAQ